jgi:vacuolar-type H+-ATPase subunit I/STV1
LTAKGFLFAEMHGDLLYGIRFLLMSFFPFKLVYHLFPNLKYGSVPWGQTIFRPFTTVMPTKQSWNGDIGKIKGYFITGRKQQWLFNHPKNYI